MTATRTRLRTHTLLGCALAALIAAPGIERRADAQAFNATPTVVSGAVNIDRSVPNFDTITVSSPSAIVDWALTFSAPAPDPIVFLPPGTTGIFQNGTNNPDFVILNRITPVGTSRIRMDGRVISQLQDANGLFVPGGTVIFSSPTGIIVGPTGVFDVGNLLLTTLDPLVDPVSTEFFVGGQLLLRGGDKFPTAAIVTEAGSRFNAPSENSWVAMVAPRVDHGGGVSVNGSAGYVGGEQVDLRIDQGLFDISILVGTTDANGVVHRGSTDGPASGAAGDNHIIYMAAAPQTQAIRLLLTGNAGFGPPISAAVENGAIILSAGQNVTGTTIEEFQQGAGPADFAIRSGTYTSDVFGRASRDFVVGDLTLGTVTFRQDLTIAARRAAQIIAEQGFVARVEGDATVSAANLTPISPGPAVLDIVGGVASIKAGTGARVEILGNATVDASARGATDDTAIAGSGSGGLAAVTSDQGRVEIGGNLAVRADGSGGSNPLAPPNLVGGAGSGGEATLASTGGGVVQVNGNADLSASGTASGASGPAAVTGASGTGGGASVLATGDSSITIAGVTTLTASGTGGDESGGGANIGGAGQGGTVSLLADVGTLDVTGGAALRADGAGGSGATGGAGQGGSARIDAVDGLVTSVAMLSVQSNGAGGTATGAGGRGGDGSGGDAVISASDGLAGSQITSGSMRLQSDGSGGNGGAGGGRGGDGIGGPVQATADAINGRLQTANLTARSTGLGGLGGAGGGRGGDGLAGGIVVGTVAGQSMGLVTGRADFATLDLAVAGTGGNGGAGGSGGSGTAGQVTLVSTGAAVTVLARADLAAAGTGGASPGGVQGAASGGTILVRADSLAGQPGSLTVGILAARSSGQGGPGNLSLPGRWQLVADRSTIRIGTADFSATSAGTPTDPAASDISPLNGSITIAAAGNFASQGDVRLGADGTGQLLGGAITLASGRDVTLDHVNRPAGLPTVDAASFAAQATRDYIAAGAAVRAGNVDLRAGRNALVGQTNAADQLAVFAGTLARFQAPAIGREVRVTSADIDVTANGRVGDATTDLVVLRVATNAAATTLGGAGQGPGYTLTQDEANRVRGDTVRVEAFGGAAGPTASSAITVRDLAFAGSGAAGGINAFEIATPGTVRIDGALLLGSAGANDAVTIGAGRLEVATDAGSLRIRDAAGAPAGALTINAGDIWVADAATLGLLAGDPNFPGRDERLRSNPGADQPRGSVEAGAIRLAPLRTLFVRNSGTAASFAGLTVGAGGLEIDPSGNLRAVVTAFGRRLNPDGTFTTNIPFFLQTDFNRGDPPGYTNLSEFNRCLINTGFCGGPILFAPPPDYSRHLPLPPREPPGDPLDESDFLAEPLIEEPVTSGADSTLWTDPDEDEDEDEDDEDEDEDEDEDDDDDEEEQP